MGKYDVRSKLGLNLLAKDCLNFPVELVQMLLLFPLPIPCLQRIKHQCPVTKQSPPGFRVAVMVRAAKTVRSVHTKLTQLPIDILNLRPQAQEQVLYQTRGNHGSHTKVGDTIIGKWRSWLWRPKALWCRPELNLPESNCKQITGDQWNHDVSGCCRQQGHLSILCCLTFPQESGNLEAAPKTGEVPRGP